MLNEQLLSLPPGAGKTQLGIPAVFAVLEVIVALGKAPRDRFGRAQFNHLPYREAAGKWRELASSYGVGASRNTLDQIGRVCAARRSRLESTACLGFKLACERLGSSQ